MKGREEETKDKMLNSKEKGGNGDKNTNKRNE